MPRRSRAETNCSYQRSSSVPTLRFETLLGASQKAVWNFHATLDALEALTPPGTRVRLPEPRPTPGPGVRFVIVVSQPPVFYPLPWECVFTAWEPPLRFIDEQGNRGPWKRWWHEHRFEFVDEHTTRLIDTIEYEPPLGPLGAIADRIFLRKTIGQTFRYRHARTADLLQRTIDATLVP
jgi:hypothetical protein